MHSFLRRMTALLCALVLIAAVAKSQDELGKILSEIGAANASKYLDPFVSGFATGMNNALYYSADLHDILGFDVGLRFGAVKIKDEQKTFNFVMPQSFTITRGTQSVTFFKGRDYDDVVGASTVAGPKEEKLVRIKTSSGQPPEVQIMRDSVIFKTPKGFDVGYLGSFSPQVNVGLPFGIEVMARYAPPIPAGDFGKASFTGFGLRYDIDQWLPAFPLDVAIHFMTQSMSLKDNADKEVLSGKATAYGAEVSTRLLFLTIFSGFQLQSSTVTVNEIKGSIGGSTYSIPSFKVDGPNKSQFTVGVRLLLLLVNVHAEANFAGTPSYGAGVGISFR
ncbi:MAG TPA: DUF6588 family protein [Bacteroidota bacterium]|nr:DUF6588 family protein [Bacteroidota bacterium]